MVSFFNYYAFVPFGMNDFLVPLSPCELAAAVVGRQPRLAGGAPGLSSPETTISPCYIWFLNFSSINLMRKMVARWFPEALVAGGLAVIVYGGDR